MTDFTVTPLSDALGAEITGLDLADGLDAATAARLDSLLARHLVLVVRDQHLTPRQMLDTLGALGPVMRQHYSAFLDEECPDVGILDSTRAERGADGRRVQFGTSCWHSDHINHELPPKCTILHAVKVPSSGGDTSFANMRTAYRRLPDALRTRLEGMHSINGLDRDQAGVRQVDRERHATPSVQPVVRTHPVTGEHALYLHPGKLERFEGMTPEASAAFMSDLVERVVTPDVTYRHRWRVGDLLLCDNRACVHRAHDDYDHEEGRLMYRLLIQGDRPFFRPPTRLAY